MAEIKTYCDYCHHVRSQHQEGTGPCLHCEMACPTFVHIEGANEEGDDHGEAEG